MNYFLKTIYSMSENLNDNNWHTMKILREGTRLILQVDNEDPVTGRCFFFSMKF